MFTTPPLPRQPQSATDLNALPPAIADRLAREGVTTLQHWRALGRKRHLIFGVTPRTIAQLDELARQVQP